MGKKTEDKSPVLSEADRYLAEIGEAKKELADIEAEWDREVREVRERYFGRAEGKKQRIKDLEKDLVKLAKKNRAELFKGDDDRVDLESGALLYSKSDRVKRARSVTVQRLEELGYTDGVKVEKKVFWDRIEKWPDAKLVAAGTERVKKENIEYELAGGGK